VGWAHNTVTSITAARRQSSTGKRIYEISTKAAMISDSVNRLQGALFREGLSLSRGKPVNAGQLSALEQEHGLLIPQEFVDLYEITNGSMRKDWFAINSRDGYNLLEFKSIEWSAQRKKSDHSLKRIRASGFSRDGREPENLNLIPFAALNESSLILYVDCGKSMVRKEKGEIYCYEHDPERFYLSHNSLAELLDETTDAVPLAIKYLGRDVAFRGCSLAIREMTPLEMAISSSDLGKIKDLIQSDRSLMQSKTKSGAPIFAFICEEKFFGAATLFLDAGYTPDHAFYYSCKAGFQELSDWLISKGFDVNETGDKDKTTWLMGFSQAGDERAVRYLLEKGADPLRKNAYGDTAMDKAKWTDKTNVVQVIARFIG